jgi:hypothetical protein
MSTNNNKLPRSIEVVETASVSLNMLLVVYKQFDTIKLAKPNSLLGNLMLSNKSNLKVLINRSQYT